MALSICSHINELDPRNERLGPTYWKEVINILRIDPQDLLDQSHPDYETKVGDQTYTMNGWLDVLIHNPQLLKAPIAIYNGKAVLCTNPSDILRLENAAKAEHKVPPHLKGYA